MVQLIHRLADGASLVAALCAMALATLGTADVIGTFFLNSPISGTVEYSSVLLACMFFLGMSAAVRGRDEISVDILLNALSERPRRIVELFNRLASLIFFGVLAYVTWGLTVHSYEKGVVTTGASGFRIWPFEAAAAIGVSVALFCMIVKMFHDPRRGSD